MITKLRAQILNTLGNCAQNSLADELGINHATMSQYATGIRPIATHHLAMFCVVFRCEPQDLVGYVDW